MRSVAIVPLKKLKANGENETGEVSKPTSICAKTRPSTYFSSGDYRLLGIPLRLYLSHSRMTLDA